MKNIIKNANDTLCGVDSPLHVACGRVTRPDPGYSRTLIIAIALHAIQAITVLLLGAGWAFIIAPVLLFFYLIIAITGGIAAIAFIPVFGPIGIIAATVFIILGVTFAIVYHGYYFTKVGVLVVIPFAAGLIGLSIWFIPVIGVFIATGIFLIPWMPFAVVLHRLVTSS